MISNEMISKRRLERTDRWIIDSDNRVSGVCVDGLQVENYFVTAQTDAVTGAVSILQASNRLPISLMTSPLSTQGSLLDPDSWKRQATQFLSSDTTLDSVFWASVIDTTNIISGALAKYYLYVSTDHSAGTGGIGLLTGSSPIGPWSWHSVVYTDVSSGSQTETPAVVWDEQGQRLIMYYQQLGVSGAAGQQTTLAAESTNGISWAKIAAFKNDVPSATSQHGDGHTGYFFPFQTDEGWIAYSLYGGTVQYGYVIWRPDKGNVGISWKTDGRSLGYATHMTQGTPLNARDCMIMGVVRSGGSLFAIVRCFDGGASGASPQDGLVCIAKIGSDYRHITSRPVPIWTPSGAESTNLRSVTWAVFDGVLYVYFALDGTSVECISHVL